MPKYARYVMKFTIMVALLLGVFVLLSFSPTLRNVTNVSKLYGKYIAHHEFATSELRINSDGTYDQRVKLVPSSKTDTVSGTWSYDGEYFTFDHNFMSVVDGFGHFDPNYAEPREEGLVILPAYRWFFRIYIGSSEGTEYKKVD